MFNSATYTSKKKNRTNFQVKESFNSGENVHARMENCERRTMCCEYVVEIKPEPERRKKNIQTETKCCECVYRANNVYWMLDTTTVEIESPKLLMITVTISIVAYRHDYVQQKCQCFPSRIATNAVQKHYQHIYV